MAATNAAAKDFRCKFCDRQFARLEHLQRHIRTHTKEKPFRCPCGRSFARVDLLRRHNRLAHSGQSDSSTSSPVALAGQRNEGGMGQNEGAHSSISNTPQPMETGSHVQPEAASREQFATRHARVYLDESERSGNANQAFLSDVAVPPLPDHLRDMNNPIMPLDSQYQEGNMFDPLQDFSNFIDNVGLTLDSDGSYFFNYSYTGEGISAFRDHLQGSDISMTISEGCFTESVSSLERPVQTSTANNRRSNIFPSQANRPEFPEVIQTLSQPEHPWKITEERRRALGRSLAPFQHVLHEFRLPSHYTLSRYYRSYADQFHKHYPLVHLPTLRIDECPPEMALIIAAVGAQYRFESRNGVALYKAAKAIAFEQMRKSEQKSLESFHNQPVALPSPSVSIGSITTRGGDDPDLTSRLQRIDMIRTLIMLIAFASWDWKAELLRDAFGFQSTLARCVREDGLQEKPSMRNQGWHSWIQTEGFRRTKLIAFAYLNVQTVAYNLPPIILNNEVELLLPCSAAEWDANDAFEWQNACKKQRGPDVYFQDAVRALLDKSQSHEAKRILAHMSPLANFILLQALIQRIRLIRQLNFPADAALRANDLEEMESSLQRWKTAWQRAPGSSLDPQNPDGPLPFTSVAFLSMASVRLHTDFGPYRRLETRDPNQIAKALFDSPPLKRGPQLITALLHATHALSLPVKMGIQYVSRSQMFFWSCQHSLCSLESAVFLCKWLQSVAATSHIHPLTAHETTVLDWVRSLVEETRESLDPEDIGAPPGSSALALQPYQLSTIVLRIWAQTFGGNTMWAVINQIGSSLRILAEHVESEALLSGLP